jgi:hypothetical protein
MGTEKTSNKQKSYSYKQRVTAKELQKGVALSLLAPKAVVRITALQNKPLPPLKLSTPGHQLMEFKDASLLHTQKQSNDNLLLSQPHQTIAQIKASLGSGQFSLQGDAKKQNLNDSYLLSVYDKYSSTSLEVSTDSLNYLYGDQIKATILLNDEENEYSLGDIEASLAGPSGEVIPMSLSEKRPNQFEASATLENELYERGGNWYVNVAVNAQFDSGTVSRTGRSAFSYAVPSATLLNVKKISSQPVILEATINVATASRYSLQGALFGERTKASIKPLEHSQTSEWLEPGIQKVQFTFDNTHQLSDDNLYLGYLRLIDYGQLKMVYQYNPLIKLSQLVD